MGRRRYRPALPRSIRLAPRWRRGGSVILALMVVAVVVGLERSGFRPPWRGQPAAVDANAEGSDWARYHDRGFRVLHVVDGDTLDIDAPDGGKARTRIRLWGVDTPEVAHGNRGDMYFGPQAKAFAEQTLSEREVQVVLAPNDTRDRFGRLLAYVFLERGGRMFNEVLLEAGYAYADPRFDHPYERQFEATEKRAVKAKVGLWANVATTDMPAWRQKSESKRRQGPSPAP